MLLQWVCAWVLCVCGGGGGVSFFLTTAHFPDILHDCVCIVCIILHACIVCVWGGGGEGVSFFLTTTHFPDIYVYSVYVCGGGSLFFLTTTHFPDILSSTLQK